MARDVVVLKWAIMGLILCASYKGILLSKLINIEYEKGLDSVEDVLRSEKTVVFDGSAAFNNLLKSDPRENVKELRKWTKPYKAEKAAPPAWVVKGYR